MMDLFKPTKDEIAAASKSGGGFLRLKNNEVITVVIKDVDEQSDYAKIESQVVEGEHKDKKYNFFVRNNAAGKKLAVAFMRAFHNDDDIANGKGYPFDQYYGKVVTTKCVHGGKRQDGTNYENFYEFKEVPSSSTPDLSADDVPF